MHSDMIAKLSTQYRDYYYKHINMIICYCYTYKTHHVTQTNPVKLISIKHKPPRQPLTLDSSNFRVTYPPG